MPLSVYESNEIHLLYVCVLDIWTSVFMCKRMCVKKRQTELNLNKLTIIFTSSLRVFCGYVSHEFKLALCSSCLLPWLTCCCWKDLSLFLKREGRTKSHPLARKANSPLRSGSRRNDVSLIIIGGARESQPPTRHGHRCGYWHGDYRWTSLPGYHTTGERKLSGPK